MVFIGLVHFQLPCIELPPHKRKANSEIGPPAKQQKTIYPAYFIPELAHVIAMCDEKIPFLNLAQELSRREIPHSGLQVEANAASLVLKILALPMPGQQPQDQKVFLSTIFYNRKCTHIFYFFIFFCNRIPPARHCQFWRNLS